MTANNSKGSFNEKPSTTYHAILMIRRSTGYSSIEVYVNLNRNGNNNSNNNDNSSNNDNNSNSNNNDNNNDNNSNNNSINTIDHLLFNILFIIIMSTKVLSLHYNRNKLGAACYDQETAAIFVLTDLLEDENDFKMTHSLLLQLEPSIIIVSKKQDVNLLAQLNKSCFGESNTIEIPDKITEMPDKEIEQDNTVNKEGIDDQDENVDESDDEVQAKSMIALHLMPSVAYNFEDAKKRILPLFESMNSTKEENNLRLAFRLDLTATNMICAFGALLKYLDAVRLGVEFEDINMKTPIRSINTIILEEIMQVDDNSKRALQIFQDDLYPSACKTYAAGGARERISLFRILKRVKSQRLTLNDWRNLYTTCNTAQQILEYIKIREMKFALLDNEMASVGKDITRITAVIFEVINFSESFMENRFVVNANVDENLDHLKELYASLPKTLTRIARMEATALNVPSSVCYIPMFDGKCNTCKNERMRKLDREIGDIKMEIIDIETNAMLKLKQLVCQYDKSIRQAVYVCATLDCVISLALTAREYNWHSPRYVDESVIDVDDGRHAITELLSTSKFVPNSIRSGGAQTKVKVLMGPNASGKSVYLKQIGIIVFLAHIGSFVPAKSAIIGPVDRIITRIHTLDCMAIALQRGTGNSLILIDEFGRGTVMEAGFSLLTSSLNYWIRKGKTDCPHIFAVSHFHSLIDHIVKDDSLLSFLTMDVILKDGNFNFQYKLVDGFIDCSYASYIASKVGIDSEIIKRANEIRQCFKCNIPIDPLDDDGELYFKIKPLLENLKNIDFTVNFKDFLRVMTELLLPMEEQDMAIMKDETESDVVKIKIGDSINTEEQIDLARRENMMTKSGESNGSTPRVLQNLGNSAVISMHLQVESTENDSTPNVLESILSVTGRSSILKKHSLNMQSSKSSRNVSFLSPVADVQNFKIFAVNSEAKSTINS
ncbi:BMA-MSH-5, isoform c [Dirofilaria immitis]|nr:BMA-MSH-5, isoform c [Dirofilaria immitis]